MLWSFRFRNRRELERGNTVEETVRGEATTSMLRFGSLLIILRFIRSQFLTFSPLLIGKSIDLARPSPCVVSIRIRNFPTKTIFDHTHASPYFLRETRNTTHGSKQIHEPPRHKATSQ